jgi:sterol desaturase/sphingolipid hydroxylase (fatty acid hydroxylase superfamily)
MEMMTAISDALSLGLLEQIFSPISRSYWPYLACSALFAVIILNMERQIRGELPAHLQSFGGESWLSRSAVNDYGLILINALIFTLVFSLFVPNIMPWAELLAAGLPHLAAQSTWWTPWLLTLCLFLVDDFVRYIGHYLEHRLPCLWELHKVHHSATVLNFLTAERHHPLSTLYFGLLMSVAIIATNVVFLLVFAEKISIITWLGGNIFWVLSNFLGGTLRHSSVWLSFGPHIERWLISPAQHQIHHSNDPKHFDRNFGGTLAIWDRLFGTLYTTSRNREILTYGLGDETQRYASLYALLAVPLRKLIQGLDWRSAKNPMLKDG